MTISIPDTLTIDNSEKYIVSIRLRPGGFSFSGYIPSVTDSFFYSEIEVDRTLPYISVLKEIFFSSEFLTWSYKAVYVVNVTSRYTLIPEGVFSDEQKPNVLSFNFSDSSSCCQSNELKGAGMELLFDMDEEVYEFCNRTLGNPIFIHHLSPSLNVWREQSRSSGSKSLYAVLSSSKILDLVCFDCGKLLFANSFTIEKMEDVIYYILYVWQQQKLAPCDDQFFIAGEVALCNNLENVLRKYLRNIRPIPVPSEAYLIGMNVGMAPVDIISLLVCEL